MKLLFKLSPIAVFLGVFLVSSLLAGDFYAVPVSSAFLVSAVYSIIIVKGSLSQRIETFSKGAADPKLLQMVWIFILAGAFAQTAKQIGALDATVNLALNLVPGSMLCAGLFLTACFISMAVGTSVGTIVALVPIATGIAEDTGLETAYMSAIIVGGAFFGDNLSFISDTTIAATKAMGCQMRDKFRANIGIVLPAVAIVTVIYLIQGSEMPQISAPEIGSIFLVGPYVLVLALALLGVNVNVTLAAGILYTGVVGIISGAVSWTGWLTAIGDGIAGMGGLITVTLLAGGVMAMIRSNGGIQQLSEFILRHAKSRRSAEFGIAALVSLANLCTANNTIAIITTGDIARDIATRSGIAPRRAASLLDTFSCLIQGIIPYGAQILMASTLSGAAAAAIIPYLYYPFVMGACAILSIILLPIFQKS